MRMSAVTAFLAGVFFVVPSQASDASPDLSGAWARRTFAFELPKSGPGPLNYSAGYGRGDYANPILTPMGAAAVRERSELIRQSREYPNPSSKCLPMASPYIFRVQEVQILQKKDEVVFLFMQDHQVRRVRLDSRHPAKITPSWNGDSIGHYEGDNLVVDSVGFKLGPLPIVDEMSGAPFSESLHVVERWRLVDYEAAKVAQENNIRDTRAQLQLPVMGSGTATEQAAFIDETYKGKGLQVTFTVDDPKIFKMPWSAAVTWRQAGGWVENACAENTHEYYNNGFTKIPQADKPDF